MEISLLAISLLMFIVSVGTWGSARKQLREAQRLNREVLSAERVNRTVSSYLELHNGHQDSGISALIKSDVGGMSPHELDEVIKRIAASTGKDPLGEGDIRPFLNQRQIAASDFITYITTHNVRSRDLTHEKLQQIAGELKKK